METIIFVGIQGSGKSSFYKERFFRTHVRINLDMLKTRHREQAFLQTCLVTRQRYVVDNTNPTIEQRARYIAAAREADFQVIGYYFQSDVRGCLRRNARRPPRERVPDKAILGTYKQLQLPGLEEGFDALYYVRIDEAGTFTIEDWRDEV